MTIVKSYQNQDHVRRLLVNRTGDRGWEVSVEHDSEIVARAHYADWHRVERARQRFDLGVLALEGWTEVTPTTGC